MEGGEVNVTPARARIPVGPAARDIINTGSAPRGICELHIRKSLIFTPERLDPRDLSGCDDCIGRYSNDGEAELTGRVSDAITTRQCHEPYGEVFIVNSATLHELVLDQAARTPDAPAVIAADQAISFGELVSRAYRVATALQAHRFAPESLVAVCISRSVDLAPCLLGILQAGYAYLPLDPWRLTDRSARILRNSGACCLIVDRALPGILQHDIHLASGDLLTRTTPLSRTVTSLHEDPAMPSAAEQLAYVIYTSGSTGTPKGVEITHGGTVNTIRAINSLCSVDTTDRILNVSPLGFDLSVYDFFGAWTAGAAVVLPRDSHYPQPREWINSARQGRVTLWNFAPALLEMFLEAIEYGDREAADCLETVRVVMLSGDRISPRLVQRLTTLKPAVRVLAMGGATEVSIWSVYNWVEHLPADSAFIPYGVALPNQSCIVMDANLAEVPLGEVGDLYIGGAGLARAYRGRPDLTAAAFISHPVGRGGRLYATGDRVRRLRDGNLEFLGRTDDQVKIRGFRVERLEVERALLCLDEVEQAAVACVQSSRGPSLHAHVVLRGNAAPCPTAALRQRLAEQLPGYMVPEQIHVLDHMPITANGKLDLTELAHRAHLASTASAIDAPPTRPPLPTGRATTQQRVAAIWREVLVLEAIGIDQHFLDLGGNSLLAFQIIIRLSEICGMDLQVRDLFENPTIATLAAALDESMAASATKDAQQWGSAVGTSQCSPA
jgi:amino acid adenylation domain-containing protein